MRTNIEWTSMVALLVRRPARPGRFHPHHGSGRGKVNRQAALSQRVYVASVRSECSRRSSPSSTTIIIRYDIGSKFAMTNIVGEKGQVVIEKPIREALGILPGSTAVQELRDDHVEIRFYPPEHRRSLRGVLAGRIGGSVPV